MVIVSVKDSASSFIVLNDTLFATEVANPMVSVITSEKIAITVITTLVVSDKVSVITS